MIRVADLETMDRTALIAAWTSTFDAPVPKGLSQTFLRRFLATEIQTRRSGGLPARLRKALAGNPDRPASRGRPALRPGARLLREWNGVTHVVDVCDGGYRWNGHLHRSLSAIAREITGAHWSGPRFFGLNAKTNR